MNSSTVNNLTNATHFSKMRGFTIVELLIVIVVIGILAAIVIVAYNGVSQRANTTKATGNAASVKKVAEAMNADGGVYPTGRAVLLAGSTSVRFPNGVLVNNPTTAGATLANVTTAADGSIPATTAANAFNTVAIFIVGTTGGVIFYRDGSGVVQPVYYGAANASSSFTQFPN
jgi:prepilin-type N-terminal cleavage/methylation domain-containing protein